eukprot:COSAG01_NODE_14506_length_1445_cov_2.125557_1_plen_22_part_10
MRKIYTDMRSTDVSSAARKDAA